MIGAFQEPIMDAILPMFFSNKNGLKFGIVTTEIFWAFAATFGITIGKVIQTRYNDPMINLGKWNTWQVIIVISNVNRCHLDSFFCKKQRSSFL